MRLIAWLGWKNKKSRSGKSFSLQKKSPIAFNLHHILHSKPQTQRCLTDWYQMWIFYTITQVKGNANWALHYKKMSDYCCDRTEKTKRQQQLAPMLIVSSKQDGTYFSTVSNCACHSLFLFFKPNQVSDAFVSAKIKWHNITLRQE